MPAPIAPFRRLAILSAVGKLVVAAGLLALPLFVEVDETGRWAGLAVVGFLVATGLYDLRQALRTDPDAVYTTVDDLSPADQVGYLRRTIRLLGGLSFLTAAYHAVALYLLETCAVESAVLVVPVGFLYETLGFWPAVAAFPALAIAGLMAFTVRLRRAERELAAMEDAFDADGEAIGRGVG